MSATPELPPDDGDATYLEKTLRHTPTDLLLDNAVSGELLRAVWRRSIRLALGTFLLFLLIWLFGGGLDGMLTTTKRDDDYTLLIVGIVLAVIAFAVRWGMFLIQERQEAISEWCTLLAGKAAAADSVYSHIAGRLRERHLPIQNFLVKRTATSFGTTGNRLVLVDGHHYIYVSVFSYGTGLYLGWNMWRIRSGSALLRQYWATGGDSLDSVGRILNLERLKAMREAVHAVCREALHIAVNDVSVAEGYGFPSGMPQIEHLPYGSAPQPTNPAQQQHPA